jgi:hypothetical protein
MMCVLEGGFWGIFGGDLQSGGFQFHFINDLLKMNCRDPANTLQLCCIRSAPT